MIFAPTRTTHLLLSVGADVENAPHPLDVIVLEPGEMNSLFFRVDDVVGRELVVTDTLKTSEWDGSARITWVFNRESRPIRAGHSGKEALIAAGDSTGAFRGLPITGIWSLRAPLDPAEEPGDPEHSPASFLKVPFKFTCES